MVNKIDRRGGEVCVQQPDGTYSDEAIHEAIMEGVDTSKFEMETRAQLLAQSVPISVLDMILPVK